MLEADYSEMQLNLFTICDEPAEENIPDSSCGKTYPEPSHLTRGWTFEPCLKKSDRPKFQCLRAVDGRRRDWLNCQRVTSHGEYWTLNIGASPSVAEESFLSQILEAEVPDKYYLSQTAVIGILRKEMKRGKRLPVELEKALIYQSLGGDVNGEETIRAACEILSVLREEIGAETFAEWVSRIYLLVQSKKVLQYSMSTQGDNEAPAGFEPENTKRSEAQGKCDLSVGFLCRLWEGLQDRCASYRRERVQQLTREFSEIVQKLSCEKARTPTILYCLREASERIATLHTPLSTVQNVENKGQGASARTESGVGTASVVRMRAGCAGGGKGALVSREKSFSLLNHNDQTLFVPDKARSLTARNDGSPCVDRGPEIIAAGFKAGQSKTGGLGYEVEKAATLGANMSGTEPTVAVYDMTHADEVMRKVPDGRAPTLNARMGTGGNQVPVVSYAMQRSDKFQESQVAHTLAARDYKSPTDLVSCYANRSFGGFQQAEQSGTLKESGGDIGGGSESIVCQKSVRRLTPTECERLQGLEDGYTLIDDKSCSDTARYKALGNGMAQPCADFVIRRIVEAVDDGQ